MNLKNIIIVILIIVICLQQCNRYKKNENTIVKVDGKPYILIKEKTDTVYKTISTIKFEKNLKADTTIFVNIYKDVDTSTILKNYFSKNVYNDTLKINNDGFVSVIDTIAENKILARKWDVKLKTMVVNDVKYLIVPPKNEFYFGFGFGGGTNAAYLGGMLKTKKNNLYQINVGLTNQLTPVFNGGFYWKL